MVKDYSKLLIDLKPMLPKGYQKKIAEGVASIKIWEVKAAFTAQPVPLESLKKIYKKAAVLARRERKMLAKANKEVRELKKTRRAAI